jgi:PAS domain S-box-containing protein
MLPGMEFWNTLCRDVFHNAPLAAFLLAEMADAPVGEKPGFDYAQRVLETALGCTGERCWRLLAQALADSRNRNVLAQAQEARGRGLYPPYALIVPTLGGDSAILRLTPRPVRDASGTLLGASAALEDVTAFRRDLHNLYASHEKFRVLFDIFPMGITISDAEGKLISVNPASERILGLSLEEQLQRSIDGLDWRIIRGDGTPMPPEEFASVRAMKTGEIFHTEDMGVLRFGPDGQQDVVWLDVMAAPLPVEGHGVVVAFIDVTARRRSQEELRVKERRYRLAVEAGMMGVWEWNTATGAMHLDPVLKTMLGYTVEDIPDEDEAWLELVHPEDRPALEETLAAHREREGAGFENEHRKLRKDGGVAWILTRGAAWRERPDGPLLLSGADLDITQRKQAEQAVEQERSRLFSFLDRLPAFVCVMSQDYRIRFGNSYHREIFGPLAPEKPCYSIHHGANAPCDPCPVQEVFESRSLSIWERTIPDNGKYFQIYAYPFQDIDGSPLVLELGIDITVSKKAQEALRASEERNRSITENLDLGLAVIAPDGRLHSANPRLGELFPHLDLDCGPTLRDLFPGCAPSPDNSKENPLLRTMSLGKTCETLWHVDVPSGARRMQVTFSPIFELDRSVRSAVFMVEDVTEKLEVQVRLQRAQKLEALGTLAGGIAHEINQPLNALELYASGLEMLLEKDRMLDRDTLLARLRWILRETGRIHEIITHMRALVRQESTPRKPATADLDASVSSALSLLKAQLQAHGIDLRMELAGDLPPVRAVPVQLEQVVINLVVNAMQALDTLPPDTRNGLEAKSILVRTGRKDGRPALWVLDNGPGLGGKENRIFDPFYTSKDAGKGMGLGLSLVHTFVTSWDGEVRGASLDSGGACFTIFFAQAAAQAEEPQAPTAPGRLSAASPGYDERKASRGN